MLKNRRYVLLSLLFSVLFLMLYPLFQTLPLLIQNLNDFRFTLQYWFSLLTPLKWFLYFLYGILFGLVISFFIWQRKKKVCPPTQMVKSGFLGGFGASLGTVLPVCPSCFSLVGFILPLNTLFLLVKYSAFVMAGSIALLFLSLWLLGAFQRR